MKTITPLICLILLCSGCINNDDEMEAIAAVEKQAYCTNAYTAVLRKHWQIEDYEKLLVNARGAMEIQVRNSIAEETEQIKILIDNYEKGNCNPDSDFQKILNKY